MKLLYGLALSVFWCCPVLAYAQTDVHNDITLPGLIDRLLSMRPVLPTMRADVERATGLRFHDEFHGTHEWVSGTFVLADGTRVDGIELRAYPSEDSPVRLINIAIDRKACTSPAGIISRYELIGLTPPGPAPAPPAAGYPVSSEPIAHHMGRYRRMPWGLFSVGFDEYLPKNGLPSCMTGVTMRVIDANEEQLWP
ncbi:hypothetical protein [Dyella sp. 20L07]|uniref:hypothetical protein n=1 Tax=Dyella sp. 20L07 TaxID=3384240 RepID=UPI003D2B83B8